MDGDAGGRAALVRNPSLRPYVAVAGVVAAMWVVELLDLLPGTSFDRWGIRPRELQGLTGIVAAPMLHAGFGHLIGNTVPLVVLGWLIATAGLARLLQVTAIVGLVAGLGVWVTGAAGSVHIGASGIVFGYVTYLITRGAFDRRLTTVVVGVVVLVLYGSVLWGLVPRPGISWQGHLFGAIGGVVAARTLAPAGRPVGAPDRGDA